MFLKKKPVCDFSRDKLAFCVFTIAPNCTIIEDSSAGPKCIWIKCPGRDFENATLVEYPLFPSKFLRRVHSKFPNSFETAVDDKDVVTHSECCYAAWQTQARI